MKNGFLRPVLLAALAVALGSAAAPAHAGTVYVPLAGDTVVGGVQYSTRVWVSNNSDATRRFTTRFVPDGLDGTKRGRDTGSYAVGPQKSQLVTDLAGGGNPGILELSGAPQLAVTSQLVAGGAVRANLPVISSQNVFKAGSTVALQGLVRSDSQVTALSLFNLGKQAATCSLTAWRADGSRIAAPAKVQLRARSQHTAVDTLGSLGQAQASGARVTVSCDRQFYAFGLVLEPHTGSAYVLPAGESAGSALEPARSDGDDPPTRGGGGGGGNAGPGEGGNNGGGGKGGNDGGDQGGATACPPGASCFIRDGAFFTTTQQEQYRYYRWPVPAGTRFKRIESSFRMTLNKWDKNPNAFYTMFYLPRGGKWLGHGVGLLVARQKGVIAAETTLDFRGHGSQTIRDHSAKMQPGGTYDVKYTYDAERRRLKLLVKDIKGNVLVNLDQPLQNNRGVVVSDGWFGIQLSDPYVRGTDHVPMWATWRNLVIAGYQ